MCALSETTAPLPTSPFPLMAAGCQFPVLFCSRSREREEEEWQSVAGCTSCTILDGKLVSYVPVETCSSFACYQGNPDLCKKEGLFAGKMASLWHLLLMFLSSLFLVAGYKLPTLRLLFQDGTSEENVEEARNLPVQAESPLGAPRRWEWKTGGDASRDDFPQRPRRKRMVPTHSSSPALTASTQTLTDTTGPGFVETGTSADVPGTTHILGENLREVSTVTTHLNVTKSTTPTRAPATTHDDHYEDDTTESVRLQSSDDLATSMGITRPQNSSTGGTGRTTVALKRTMEVTTGMGLLVDEVTSGTSSRTSEGTADVSTVTLRQSTVAAGPHFRTKGKSRDVSVTASSTATTVPAKPPSQKSAPGTTTILVGKCLLAIFLLALVAGIFIVITAVLATLLWRQKQAYKLSQHNHTEMVCISSLLAADEAEEAGGRHPRVRRVRMLGENSSETEMDNLTLNSFLPDH